MRMSRRGVLGGAAVVTAAAAGYGAQTPPIRRRLGWTGPDGTVPDVAPVLIRQTAWGAWAGASGPTVLALHGRGGSVQWWLDLGLPQFLNGVGLRCALVAGGDDYWVNFAPPVPYQATLGISMGGFGVLDLATRQPTAAVAAISPALFPTWPDAERVGAFPNKEVWQQHEPLRHTDQLTSPVGIWCGREDPFFKPAEQLSEEIGAAGSFEHGEHSDGYWRRELPDALSFLSAHL